jgi:predicted RNase H-like HicB family nuclease
MKRKHDFKWSIALQWSEEDEAYIALIHELPGHSAFGDTPERAVKEARIAAELYVETLQDHKLPVPEPDLMTELSGQVRLRMPRHLHGRLADLAKREGMSLNTYMVYVLTRGTTAEDCRRAVAEALEDHPAKRGSQRRLARTA